MQQGYIPRNVSLFGGECQQPDSDDAERLSRAEWLLLSIRRALADDCGLGSGDLGGDHIQLITSCYVLLFRDVENSCTPICIPNSHDRNSPVPKSQRIQFTVVFSDSVLINSWMSSARHAVIFSPSFTDFGKRPDLTPAHQVDLLTGKTASTAGSRIKPVEGMELLSCMI